MERGSFGVYDENNEKHTEDGKLILVLASIWDLAARFFAMSQLKKGSSLIMHEDDLDMFDDLRMKDYEEEG